MIAYTDFRHGHINVTCFSMSDDRQILQYPLLYIEVLSATFYTDA